MTTFYAKSNNGINSQLVEDHCIIVGKVAEILAKNYLNYEEIDLNLLGFICALHDVGKITPAFQKKIYAAIGDNSLDALCNFNTEKANECTGWHSGASVIAISRCQFIKNKIPNILSVINRHHGYSSLKRIYGKCNEYNIYMLNGQWEQSRNNIIKLIGDYFSIDLNSLNDIKETDCGIVSGILAVSDWISSEFFQDYCKDIDDIQILEKINELKLLFPDFKDLTFNDIFGFSLRESQQKIVDSINDYGIYLIESPTGSGKTEIALSTAYKFIRSRKCNGMMFALPPHSFTCADSVNSELCALTILSKSVIVFSHFFKTIYTFH